VLCGVVACGVAVCAPGFCWAGTEPLWPCVASGVCVTGDDCVVLPLVPDCPVLPGLLSCATTQVPQHRTNAHNVILVGLMLCLRITQNASFRVFEGGGYRLEPVHPAMLSRTQCWLSGLRFFQSSCSEFFLSRRLICPEERNRCDNNSRLLRTSAWPARSRKWASAHDPQPSRL